jgi:hypothetical protein
VDRDEARIQSMEIEFGRRARWVSLFMIRF